MVRFFRFHGSEWLSGGAHFGIIIAALQADTAAAWPWALAAMAGVSFFAWIATHKRYRQIHDLPTSKVASAAQGYVELFGRSEQIEGIPVMSKLTGLPCCWYRYYVERKSGNDKWVYDSSGASNDHFLLVDDTGQCVVSPEGAEVMSRRKQTWQQGDYRYTEWLLLPRGILYALGEFSTTTANVTEHDERADVSHLLGEWKKDKQGLHERFDLDRDGTIDMREWEMARLQAQREIRKRHAELRTVEGVHLLRKPADGRLFLLANELPDKLGRRFAIWSAVHLVILFGAGGAALFLLL
ncbi:MAG: E3 ubiquitin ligase family protein [Betaproteobacteria bacterium]|nr:E3 ubiquitin ligase family protein [Betaproteobacteria bacterium]